jgi:hypothetical protein
MSRRKPLAALAAVTAALALAVPVASASAATTVPARATSIGVGASLAPGALECQILVGQLRFAQLTGNTVYANVVANVLLYSGCGGAAI